VNIMRANLERTNTCESPAREEGRAPRLSESDSRATVPCGYSLWHLYLCQSGASHLCPGSCEHQAELTIMRISRHSAIPLTCVAIVLLVLAGAAISDGRAAVEKIVQRIATPVGLVWVGLAIQCLAMLSLRRRRACAWSFALWVFLTLSGNDALVERGFWWLERPYAHLDVKQGPAYDAIIVLGGGATGGVDRRPQINEAGDRILLAAQLYHAGRAPRIICTGERIEALDPDQSDPADLARRILTSLGVPEDVIVQSGGRNTSEELRTIAADGLAVGRVGLVTSAWHMPRVMRLAEHEGLRLEPVPAEFRSLPPGPPSELTFSACTLSAIPNAETLAASARLLKELLAGLVGR